MKRLIALVVSFVALVALALPAHGHGSYQAAGSVNLTGIIQTVGGSGQVTYDYNHAGMTATVYLERKYASQTGFAVIASEAKSCINCRSLGAILTSGQSCTHNATYRIRIVHKVSNHTQVTSNRGARTLC